MSADRARASIDLGAIERNCSRLRSELRTGVQLCAVVKADGYGHGAVHSARAAVAGGAGWLAVATAQEAGELREAGLSAPRVLVMGALTRAELADALAADADVVVWREQDVQDVAGAGGGRVHVKLDSGMGRLGTRDVEQASQVLAAAQATPGVEPAGARGRTGPRRRGPSRKRRSRSGPCRNGTRDRAARRRCWLRARGAAAGRPSSRAPSG